MNPFVDRSLTRVCGIVIAALCLSACQNPGRADSSSGIGEAAATSIEQIIAMNSKALGGEDALDSVTTMVKRSRVVEGDYDDMAVFATDRLGRMRVDIFADGQRVFAESYDGENGYQWSPEDGQSAASERGTVALSHTPQLPNHIFRLKDAAANGHRIELVEHDQIDGNHYAVLKLTLSDGFQNFLWIDLESGFVTRSRNTRALHVDINDEETVIESRVSDFRRTAGIMHPHSVVEVNLKTGETLVEITLLSLELNDKISDSYFQDLVHEGPVIE